MGSSSSVSLTQSMREVSLWVRTIAGASSILEHLRSLASSDRLRTPAQGANFTTMRSLTMMGLRPAIRNLRGPDPRPEQTEGS